jgi:AraC-like DNA-binding protein
MSVKVFATHLHGSVMGKDTVSMHFVAAAVARLSRTARTQALTGAAIPEALLKAPHARVPAHSFAALWLNVSQALDDEFFGLDSRRMKVGSFALLCRAALSSTSLASALHTALKGFNSFFDNDQDALISIESRIAGLAARRFADETLLVMVHGLTCWLAGKRVPVLSASFAYPRPDYAQEYLVMYSERLSFDAPRTVMRLDARLLRMPIAQTAESLKVFLKTAPQSVFLKYRDDRSFSARIRRHLRKFVGRDQWPTLAQLAQVFHVSQATLRRRLAAECTSFQKIKDDVRRDAAIHLLCASNQPIEKIGLLVGFADPSAFRRAFKTWIGLQPGEYRRQKTGLAATV